jgi:hypothetical protein
MKKVVIYLVGATGNQLFVLFAGLSLANTHRAKLILDSSYLQPAKVRHPGGIEDFDIWLDGKRLEYTVRKFRKNAFLLLMGQAIYKITNFLPVTRRLTKQFRSKVFGYDPGLTLMRPSCTIFGYFQTYHYIEAIKNEGHSLKVELASPSEWFVEMSREIQRSPHSVGIHLRRGDYIVYKDLIGMLSDDYFLDILKEIENSYAVDRVFIFSDSVKSAEILGEKIGSTKCLIIVPPSQIKPAESLMLFGLCSYQVISNSSFSWWGSYLSTNLAAVYAPDPWFRNQNEPAMLIPENWNRRKSLWLN